MRHGKASETEVEQPAMREQQLQRVGLAAVLLLALALRAPGLTWALPDADRAFPYHPDEPTLVETGRHIARTGDLNPHFFNYGSLTFYLAAATFKAMELGGEPAPSAYYLAMRLWSVAFGLGTVALAFLLGRRWGGAAAGLVTAAVVAVTPVSQICSTYATVDSLGTFLLTAALHSGLRVLEEHRPRDCILAGLCAGLAAGVKYVGLLALLVPVTAVLLRTRGKVRREDGLWLGAAIATGVVAFLLTTPYALLDTTSFWRDFSFEMQHKAEGGSTVPPGMSGLAFLLTQAMPCGLTWPVVVLGAMGLGVFVARRTQADILLTAWLVLLLLVTGSGREVFVRYTMPLVPLMALTIVGLLGKPGTATVFPPAPLAALVIGTRKRRLSLVSLLVVTGLLYSLLCAAAYAGVRARPDVRDEAMAFIQAQAPSHRPSVGLREEPWFDDPPIGAVNGGPRTRGLFARAAQQRGWRVTISGWNAERLDASVPKLFVASEFDYRPEYLRGESRQASASFFAQLETRYDLIREFRSEPTLGPLHFPDAHINDWRYVNPEIRVYVRRAAMAGAPAARRSAFQRR